MQNEPERHKLPNDPSDVSAEHGATRAKATSGHAVSNSPLVESDTNQHNVALRPDCGECGAKMHWVSSGPIPGRAAPLTSYVCSADPSHTYGVLDRFRDEMQAAKDGNYCQFCKRPFGDGTVQADDPTLEKVRTVAYEWRASVKAAEHLKPGHKWDPDLLELLDEIEGALNG
jgi:hypothetical protein